MSLPLSRVPVYDLSQVRLALFSGNYNYTRDGANRALNRLVAHMISRGAMVRVYSPTSSSPAFEPAGDLISVPSFSIPGRKEFRVALGLPRSIGQDVRRFEPNLIHVSAPDWLGMSAQYLAKSIGVPTVASFHTRFETYFDFYRLGWLQRWAWKRQSNFYALSELVLAPNEPMRLHLQDMGVDPSKIAIWSRGVDESIFSPNRRSLAWRRKIGFADDEIVVLFFGRLVREKGVATFVQVIKQLEAAQYRHRVLVVGAGPAENELRQGLPSAVFTGELEGGQLGRAIASADVLLNPSLTEAFGNVNLEAMASGLAIVSADVGSARALLTDKKTGLLCTSEPAVFARAVQRLIKSAKLRSDLSKAALIESQAYRWEKVLTGVEESYIALLDENRSEREN